MVLHASILALGVAAVAIPIAIHLLVKRKKPPMPWGAMRFVQLAVKQTRRRMMLERWLLLACRCLLVLAAGIALARPLWSDANAGAAGAGQTVYVIIDNSLASGAVDSAGVSDLQKNVAAARLMLESLRPGDQAGVIVASRPARGVIMPPSGNIASVIEVLERLEPTSSGMDVRGALAAAASEIEKSATQGPEGGSSGLAVVHLISQWRGVTRSLNETEVSVFASAVNGERGTRAALVMHPPAGDTTLGSMGIASVRLQRPLVLASGIDGGSGGGVEPSGAGAGAGAGAGGAGGPDVAAARGDGTATAIVTVDVVRSGAGVNQEQTSEVVLQVVPVTTQQAGSQAPAATSGGTSVRVNFAPGQRVASAIAAVPVRVEGTGNAGVSQAAQGRSGGFVMQATVRSTAGTGGAARDSLAGDNTFQRGLVLKPAIRIGIIADEQAWSPSARQAWRLGTVSSDRVDAFTPGHWLSLALQPALAEQSILQSTSGAIGGLQIVDLEQGPIDRAVLTGLDAVIVLSPQIAGNAGTGGWGALREFVNLGGLVIVMPQAGGDGTTGGVAVDREVTWTEGMTSAFGLDWTFAGVREPPQRDGQNLDQQPDQEPLRWPLLVGPPGGIGEVGAGGPGAAGARGAAGSGELGGGDANRTSQVSPEVAGRDVAGGAGSSGDLLAALRGELAELASAVSFERLLSPQRRPAMTGATIAGATETQVYLSSSDGQSVLLSARPQSEGGMLVYLATALDLGWTDLVAKPLMVPLMQELVRQGVGLSVASAGMSGSQGLVTASMTAGQRPALRPGLRVLGVASTSDVLTQAGVYAVEDETGRLRGALTVQAAVHEQLLDAAQQVSVLRYGQQLFGESGQAGSTTTNVVMVADATRTTVLEALRTSAIAASGASSGNGASVDGSEREQRASSSIWLGLALIAALVEIVFARASSQTSKAGGQP